MTRIQIAEEKKSYMQLLDDWSNENVIDPIWDLPESHDEQRAVIADVKKVIREKVLESYRNGQKAPSVNKNKSSLGRDIEGKLRCGVFSVDAYRQGHTIVIQKRKGSPIFAFCGD